MGFEDDLEEHVADARRMRLEQSAKEIFVKTAVDDGFVTRRQTEEVIDLVPRAAQKSLVRQVGKRPIVRNPAFTHEGGIAVIITAGYLLVRKCDILTHKTVAARIFASTCSIIGRLLSNICIQQICKDANGVLVVPQHPLCETRQE